MIESFFALEIDFFVLNMKTDQQSNDTQGAFVKGAKSSMNNFGFLWFYYQNYIQRFKESL